MSMFASTFRWLQRKRYQYEVTFSLYMLTPTEKFIFSASHTIPLHPACPMKIALPSSHQKAELIMTADSFLFLFFSMIVIALTLYLPQHIAFLTNRAWFYYNGDESTKGAVKSVIENVATSTILVEKVQETVLSTGTSAWGMGKEL
ncbi:hypothetical protein D0Z07_5155 [Hyphodiscus hymeniophilus]|uniref:Uncharacterized protein n=1 Tax=Hyphodiscus hymeniophilus TaxID=353542 RepID=A0A9P6VHS7_9HELO|nr:hypothetical protein D0Z07_5155 [Hyphodiscus hymeniophilus]